MEWTCGEAVLIQLCRIIVWCDFTLIEKSEYIGCPKKTIPFTPVLKITNIRFDILS